MENQVQLIELYKGISIILKEILDLLMQMHDQNREYFLNHRVQVNQRRNHVRMQRNNNNFNRRF